MEKNSDFYIGEVGFGIGINFLTTCKSWLNFSRTDQVLEFYSFDKYLFQKNNFKEILEINPELMGYGSELEKNYPVNINGVQKISLFNGRVSLNLIIGDINATQEYIGLMEDIDAWFLDGFSPSKNPELWSEDLFESIYKSCHKDSTFSTYTASGLVKKNLTKTGFIFNKASGFAKKRHMLKGNSFSNKSSKKRFNEKVAVIGSGITGCMLSYNLAKKGIEVDLFEQSEFICSGASSHELLVTYPRLSAYDSAYGRFNLQSYLYATNFYKNLYTDAWVNSGVLILNHDELSEKRQASLLERRSDGNIYQYKDHEEASEIAGIEIKNNALLYPDAGYILPTEMCHFLIESPKINLISSSPIRNISRKDGKIVFNVEERNFEYTNVCLCTGGESLQLIDIDGLSRKRGQVTHIESRYKFSDINLPICAKGYISPKINNLHVVGSSYSDIEHEDVLEEEHLSNMENLKVISDEETKITSGRVGIRAVSLDHMPIVGKKDGIYINTCHGSRASVTAPICAEIISSLITQKAPPLEKREMLSLSPGRFN